MRRPARSELSAAERDELWRRWRQGESLCAIGRALGRFPTTLNRAVRYRGGIAPPQRKRNPRHLSLPEREEISRDLGAGHTLTRIAARLGRPVSTVSREVARNGGVRRYRATVADSRAWGRAERPQACKLAGNAQLRREVAAKLRLQWSTEQICGWLRITFLDDEGMQVSHETIYRSLFVQARGVLKEELLVHLRTRRMMRRSRHASSNGQHRGQIVDAVSISERPPQVEDRAVPAHWEGDLLEGSGGSAIATLVERKSRYTILVKLDGKQAKGLSAALSRQVVKLPAELRRSPTWDRGLEMAHHKTFTVATDVAVYFCDPQSPWQRGTNENTNRLLRQYFPKRTDLSGYSQAHLNKIAQRLDQRPRKTLDLRTPADMFAEELR